MPTISVTQEEFDAILFFRDETIDKIETACDQQYIDDYEKHNLLLDNFKQKYYRRLKKEQEQQVTKMATYSRRTVSNSLLK